MSKKKKSRKRARIEALTVKLDEQHINPETGRIEVNLFFDIINDVNQIKLAHNDEVIPVQSLLRGYIGEKKFRTLSEIPTDENDFSFNFIKKLKRYDLILAMDTNSAFFKGIKISIGVPLRIIGKISDQEIKWELIPLQVLVLIGESEKIENKNWVSLIKNLLDLKGFNHDHKIGLIVDSDLGNLKSYNDRTLPIAEEFFLPQNFELIYASDRSNDNILNEIMLTCHRASKEFLNIYLKCLDEACQENE